MDKTTFKSFKIHSGIIEAMTDSKLDPKEFYTFMGKYGEFIIFGMTAKKMDAMSAREFADLTVAQSLSVGFETFQSFLIDFQKEYETKLLKNIK